MYWSSFYIVMATSSIVYSVASVCFLVGALIDLCEKMHNWQDRQMISLVIVFFYLVGGLAFVTGSVLFFPTFKQSGPGYWVFRVGSASYFAGSMLIILNLTPPRKPRKIIATGQYMLGSCLFVVGGIISQMGHSGVIPVTIWVIGSVAFTGGASLGMYLNF